jgi:CcmD family protein
MNGIYYVLAANVCIWIAIFGYLIHLQLKCRKLYDIIETMKKKADAAINENGRSN